MNPLALELNTSLDGTIAGRFLSRMGKRLYFPKGIIAQAAEAKKNAHTANATIGMAYDKGKLLILSAIAESMPGLTPDQIVAYAPTAGIEKLRAAWQKLILEKNPSLNGEKISLPVVTAGLTSGVSAIADLFFDEGSTLISSDPCWDNYSLIFEERRAAVLKTIPLFSGKNSGQGMNLDALRQAVKEEAKTGQVRLVLNLPNNPTGYSPTKKEAEELAAIFLEAAESGADILVLCDDAYFGLFYEDDIYPESVFSLLCDLHERILAVKIDGPIKEDYVWGFRTGFVTFGSRGLTQEHYEAMIIKLMGAIRSAVSCVNTAAQYIVMNAMLDKRTPAEKKEFAEMLFNRYKKVKEFISENPDHPTLTPYPFNSGYFMSFKCESISAEALRKELLSQHGIGTVSLGDDCIRIAFSSMEEEQIPIVLKTLFDCAAAAGTRL